VSPGGYLHLVEIGRRGGCGKRARKAKQQHKAKQKGGFLALPFAPCMRVSASTPMISGSSLNLVAASVAGTALSLA
jgi:hypothetical protein